jgi:hypothetical protein
MFNGRLGQLAEASEDYHREGVAFVRGLLDPDPDSRMTAKQALNHPFLVGSFPDVAPALIPTRVARPRREPRSTLERQLLAAIDLMCNENAATPGQAAHSTSTPTVDGHGLCSAAV